MKKIYFLFCVLLLNFSVKAQVNYNFAASSGTYTPLSGATSVTLVDALTSGGDPLDDGFANNIPIGFSLTYNGNAYTTIHACTNGFASFGVPLTVDDAMTYYSNSLDLGPTSLITARPLLAPLWDDHALSNASGISYITTGSAPNRVFTLQFSDIKWRYTAAAASISCQIKLYETTNVVEFVYNQEAGSVGSSPTASIGITASGTGSGNFMSLNNSSTTPVASTTTATNSISTRPATGQVYTFTPLSGCTGTPTAGVASSSSPSICDNQAFTLALTGGTAGTGITYQWQRSGVGLNTFTNISGATSPNPQVSQTGAFDYRCVITCTNSSSSVNSNVITVGVNTTNCPPLCTTNISPANAATNVSYQPNVVLTWNSSAGATSYDVYIGTTNPPTSLTTNVTTTTVNLTGGASSTLYYWYIVPKSTNGTLASCASSVTSFTTGAPAAPPANNDCAAAVAISAYSGTTASTTIGATASVGVPTCSPSAVGTPDDDVWFTFTTLTGGNATITVVGSTGFDAVIQGFSGTCGALTSIGCADATLGAGTETLNLTGLTAGQTYYIRVYDWYTAASGTFNISATGTALPVSISSFKGERNGVTNLLSWTTTTEVNNAGFELQRSADGINFSKLTFVQSKANNGNSSQALTYNFSDIKPLGGTGYYRLKQMDKDGKSTLSDIVLIKGIKPSKLELVSVYPNPVINTLNMGIAAVKAEKITFIVSDITGKVIISKIISVVAGDNLLPIDVANLANGTYTVKAVCADGCETAIKKFVKQ